MVLNSLAEKNATDNSHILTRVLSRSNHNIWISNEHAILNPILDECKISTTVDPNKESYRNKERIDTSGDQFYENVKASKPYYGIEAMPPSFQHENGHPNVKYITFNKAIHSSCLGSNTLEIFVEPFDKNEISVILPRYSTLGDMKNTKEELPRKKIIENETQTDQKLPNESTEKFLSSENDTQSSERVNSSKQIFVNRTNDRSLAQKDLKSKNDSNKSFHQKEHICKYHRNYSDDSDKRSWVKKVVHVKDDRRDLSSNYDISNYKFENYNFKFLNKHRKDVKQRNQDRCEFQPQLSIIKNIYQRNFSNHYKNIGRQSSRQFISPEYCSEQSSLIDHSYTNELYQSKRNNKNYNCNSPSKQMWCPGNQVNRKSSDQYHKCNKLKEYSHGKNFRRNNLRASYSDKSYGCCGESGYQDNYCNENVLDRSEPELCCREHCECNCIMITNCCKERQSTMNRCTCPSPRSYSRSNDSGSQDKDGKSDTVYCESSESSNLDNTDCDCPCPCRCPQFIKPPPYCLNSTYRMNYFPKCIPRFRRYKECDNLRLPLC